MKIACRALLCLVWVSSFIARGFCGTYVVVLRSGALLSELEKNPALKNAERARAYKKRLVKEHDELLSSFSNGEQGIKKIHDYVNVINGFSASLSEDQVEQLKAHEGVQYVLKNRLVSPMAADSPSFRYMGLQYVSQAVWPKTTGKGVVIGVVDSGIFPESPSFNDKGLDSIPTKAICQPSLDSGPSVNCNNKVIGARYFYRGYEAIKGQSITNSGDYLSPRDTKGHGTHTASIAAGAIVRNVLKRSILRGVAYDARIIAYKVCWGLGDNNQCATDDVIAALEAGIGDGVHVFSISLGSTKPPSSYIDLWSLYMLEVVAKGIPIVLSAGNSGGVGTVANSAPWVLTVGASGFPDRNGNRLGLVKLKGKSTFKGSPSPDWDALSKGYFPLVTSMDVANSSAIELSELCHPGSLDPEKARGKIVVCLRGQISRLDKSLAVSMAGGRGMILYNDAASASLNSDLHHVPSIHVLRDAGLSIIQYINSTSNPTATSEVKSLSTPYITGFSSTGPNPVSQHILKPDIAAPGENIIGAFTNFSSNQSEPTGSYAAFSGTSMATPYVSAAVGLLRSLNSSWKPSWLYSAIITSALLKSTKNGCIQDFLGVCANPFQMGGGHLDVRKAMDPGLVYDVSANDYKYFLCTETGGYKYVFYLCPRMLREVDFNFPYLSIPNFSGLLVTSRNLTLVGPPAEYKVSIKQPIGAKVTVVPSTLKFTKPYQTLSYSITVQGQPSSGSSNGGINGYYSNAGYTFGRIVWSDKVRAVKFNVALRFA